MYYRNPSTGAKKTKQNNTEKKYVNKKPKPNKAKKAKQ